MLKVFHCADIHLDSPFTLFSPRESEKRRNELRAAFTSALLFAREKKFDVFLISGDLFDSEYVTRDTRELLKREFAKCGNMHIFISPGNHDPFSVGSFYESTDFPENVHIFGKERECVRLPELGADIYGFGFTSKDMLSSPVVGWNELDKSRINILVCHGDMSSSSSLNGPVTEQEIASSGFDYVALGHIHKGTKVMRAGNVFYAYPGCIEGRGFDECGYKGALCGIVEKGNVDLQFKRFSKSRYEELEIDISEATDKMFALDIIREKIRPFTEDTALRITLTGELKNAFVISSNEIGRGCEYPYFIEIKDKTSVCADMGELEISNTLKGVFRRNIAEALERADPDSEEKLVLSLALKYGISALDDRNVTDYEGGGRK